MNISVARLRACFHFGLYQGFVWSGIAVALITCHTARGVEATVLVGLTNHVWRYSDTGTNWSTAWRAPAFNDSAWPSGRGVFGWESSPWAQSLTNTILRLTNSVASGAITTYYFRTQFTLPDDPRAVTLVASNVFDDGLIVYLNGVEAYRANMPNGEPTVTTLANRAADEGVFLVTNVSSSSLVQGLNWLAVELHQNTAASGDAVMGLSLHAVPITPTPLTINEPWQQIIVEETKPLLIQASVAGEPLFFQWRRDGVLLPNATTNPLVFASVAKSNAGTYTLEVTNSLYAATGIIAKVTVTTDTNAPLLIDAEARSDTTVVASFSERLDLSSATNAARYQITNTVTGATVPITAAALTNGTNVLLTTAPRTASGNYVLTVNGVRDVSPQLNVIVTNSAVPIATWQNVATFTGSSWRFVDPAYADFGDVPDQGTEWRRLDFNETNPTNMWSEAAAPFVLVPDPADNPFGETNPYTGLLQTEFVTKYFRRRFYTIASPGGAQLFLSHFIDDGAVFYLNEQEVLRFNMPLGEINYLTSAATSITPGQFTSPQRLSSPIAYGSNIVAVELHQFVPYDLNAIFAAQLDLRAQSLVIGPVVITSGPHNQTVDEGSVATFTVMQAAGQTFQWQMNNTNIPGATNSILTFPSVPLAYNGAAIRLRVANSNSTQFSSNAVLSVRADTTPPTLLSALFQPDGTILLKFSEPLLAATATSTSNFLVTNSVGQSVAVTSATLTNGTDVILHFASLPATRYAVVVSRLRDASVSGNLMPTTARFVGFDAEIQPMSGMWRFDDQNIDRGTTWTAPTHNDAGWKGSGAGLLGTNVGTVPPLPEPLRTGLAIATTDGTRIRTHYFRALFNAFAAPTATLTFRTIVDDGCVIFLNGLEVFRRGMPTGAVIFATAANRTVSTPTLEGPFTAIVTNLVDGTNVIAVEVHQPVNPSGDVYWAGEFKLAIPSVSPPPPPDCEFVPFHPPALRAWRFSSNSVDWILLSWNNPQTNSGPCPPMHAHFTLQQTPEWKVLPTDPGPILDVIWHQRSGPNISEWTDVSTNTAHWIPATNAMRFYRLKLLP